MSVGLTYAHWLQLSQKAPHVDGHLDIGTKQSSGHQSNGQLTSRFAVGFCQHFPSPQFLGTACSGRAVN